MTRRYPNIGRTPVEPMSMSKTSNPIGWHGEILAAILDGLPARRDSKTAMLGYEPVALAKLLK